MSGDATPIAAGLTSGSSDDHETAVSPVGRELRLRNRVTPRVLELVGLIVPIVAVLVLGVARRWTYVGGFTYFHTVDQIVAGNGPVFNAGERVEAFVSPAWLFALTVGDLLSPFRLEAVSIGLSLISLVAAMALASWGSLHLMRSFDPTARMVPFGSAMLAALWPVWVWATGGMETSLTYLWIAGCLVLMTRWAVSAPVVGRRRTPVPVLTLVVIGSGWVVRPDLLPSSILFVAIIVTLSARSRRELCIAVAIAAAVPTGYQIFRMGYYGLVVPMPAVSRDVTVFRLGTGWSYLLNFVSPYGLIVPIMALVIGVAAPILVRGWNSETRRPRAVMVTVTISGVVHVAALVAIGGDFVHARLLLPALFAIVAPFFVVPARRQFLAAGVVTAIWVPFGALVLRSDGVSSSVLGTMYPSDRRVTYLDYGFEQRGHPPQGFVGAGMYQVAPFATVLTPLGIQTSDDEVVVVSHNIGLIGYVMGTDVRAIDLDGAIDPVSAHFERGSPWFVGLERPASTPWILATTLDDATAVFPGLLSTSNAVRTDPTGAAAFETAAWARFTVSCPGFVEFEDRYAGPLSVGQLAINVWGSIGNSLFRIPPNPEAASFSVCGRDAAVNISAVLGGVERGPRLRSPGDPGRPAVTGRCAVVSLATQRGAWVVIEAGEHVASIPVGDGRGQPTEVPLFEIGPYDDVGAFTTVFAETNGLGDYRVVSETSFFPPEVGPWTPIASDPARVVISPDLLTQRWQISSNFEMISTMPMSTTSDTTLRVHVPAPTEAPGVEFLQPPTTAACERINRD